MGGILTVTLLLPVMLGGSEALAGTIPPPSCENLNPGYNVQVIQGTQGGNQSGINADVWFGNFDYDCNRATSLGVLSDTGNGWVEWGWVLGYSSCNNTYYSNPRMFLWAKPNNSPDACVVVESSSQGTFYDMTLRDANQDTVFTATRGTNISHTIDVNFGRGDAITNAERDCTCDSAWSHYKGLRFMVSGSQTWWNWTDPDLYPPDTDPDYHWLEISATEHKVVHD